MKTKFYSLLLGAFFTAGTGFCQNIAHVALYEYFSALPASPNIPEKSAFASVSPVTLEEHGDLTALGDKLENAVKVQPTIIPQLEGSRPHAISGSQFMPLSSETSEVRQGYDELLPAANQMEKIKTEYGMNFRNIENQYVRNAAKSPENTLALTREKISEEASLLSRYLDKIKPEFKTVDNLLGKNHYGDGARSKEIQELYRGAQRNEALILSEIIERMKLERIELGNCARLAQRQ